MSAAEGGVVLSESLYSFLECPICKQRYKVPKVLTCLHIFCEDCLDTYVKTHDLNFPPCPVCRKTIMVPGKGIAAFPTQSFYQELIAQLEVKETVLDSKMCDYCDKSKTIVSKCLTCDKEMCSRCNNTHAKVRGISAHTVMTMDEIKSSPLSSMTRKNVLCSDHPDDVLKLCCVNCEKPVCLICKATDHESHCTEELGKAATSSRHWLESMQSVMNANLIKLKDALGDIGRVETEFQLSVEQVESDINKTIQSWIDQIEVYRQQLLTNLQTRRQSVQKRLQTEKERIEMKHVCTDSIMQFSQSVRLFGCNSEVVDMQRDIKKKWSHIQSQEIERMGQNFKVTVKYNVNSKIEEFLKETQPGTLTVEQLLSSISVFKTGIKDSGTFEVQKMSFSQDKLALSYQRSMEVASGGYIGVNIYSAAGDLISDREIKNPVQGRQKLKPFATKNGVVIVKKFQVNKDGSESNNISVVQRGEDGLLQETYTMADVPRNSTFTINTDGHLQLYDIAKQAITTYTTSGSPVQEIKNIPRLHKISGMMTTSTNDMIILGKDDNNVVTCNIVSSDGKHIGEYHMDEHDVSYPPPLCPHPVCVDDKGNILFGIQCINSGQGCIYLFENDHGSKEVLILQTDSLTLPGMDIKEDGLLYVATNRATEIQLVRYLP